MVAYRFLGVALLLSLFGWALDNVILIVVGTLLAFLAGRKSVTERRWKRWGGGYGWY